MRILPFLKGVAKVKYVALVFCALISGCSAGEMQLTQEPPRVQTQTPDRVIVFIGDSITAAWHELSETDPRIINAGISGQVSQQMLDRFDTDVMSHKPSTVEILAGTNDVRSFPDPSIDAVALMASRAAMTGACVIIGLIPPNSVWGVRVEVDASVGNMNIGLFNDQLRALGSAYGYYIADYHSVLVLPDGSIDQSLFADGIHPNDPGRARMWTVVKPLLDKCELR